MEVTRGTPLGRSVLDCSGGGLLARQLSIVHSVYSLHSIVLLSFESLQAGTLCSHRFVEGLGQVQRQGLEPPRGGLD